MAWVLLVIGTIAAAELFLRMPVVATAKGLFGIVGKAQRTIRSPRISDHWKEKALLTYARQLFIVSGLVFGLMAVAVLPLALLSTFGIWTGIDLLERLTHPTGVAVSVAVACGYVLLRRQLQDV